MAAAEAQTVPQPSGEKGWQDIALQALKRNNIRLVPYVPHGARKVLVIDECQYLQTKIVNCLK